MLNFAPPPNLSQNNADFHQRWFKVAVVVHPPNEYRVLVQADGAEPKHSTDIDGVRVEKKIKDLMGTISWEEVEDNTSRNEICLSALADLSIHIGRLLKGKRSPLVKGAKIGSFNVFCEDALRPLGPQVVSEVKRDNQTFRVVLRTREKERGKQSIRVDSSKSGIEKKDTTYINESIWVPVAPWATERVLAAAIFDMSRALAVLEEQNLRF